MTLDEFIEKLTALKLRLEPGAMIRFRSPLDRRPVCPIAAVVESQTERRCAIATALIVSPLSARDTFEVLMAADRADHIGSHALVRRLRDCAWTDEKEAAKKLIEETRSQHEEALDTDTSRTTEDERDRSDERELQESERS